MPDPTIPNVGLFGTPGTLPSDPGPIEPPILTNDWTGARGLAISGAGMGGDFWTRMDPNMGYINPSIEINAGDSNYPAPGTGAQKPSIISRILGFTPQGMLRNAILNAVHANQTQANMQANPGSWQGAPSVPPGGALFGYNPAQGGGTPHYDFGTGTVTATPSLNPLYTTGGGWQSVANAPSDFRWSQNSGTGNWTADQTTKAIELAGGIAGAPNRMGTTTDRGHDIYYPNAGTSMGMTNESGDVVRSDKKFQGGRADPRWVLPSQQESAALGLSYTQNADKYNQWLQEHNQWYYGAQPNNGLQPFAWLNPTGGNTIASAPSLPNWLLGG